VARASSAARDKKFPDHIGRYEVVAPLATGGMAEIFLGRVVGPSGFERPVVIKRILPHLATQASFVDMFLDEARIVSGIRHENVVQVQELGHDDGELFLVMEYLEGETASTLMKRLVARGRSLPYALAAHLVAEACAGLHAAHELTDHEGRKQSLVHRDVTPQNIFVTYTGGVKLLDFGIAKAADRITRTEAGQVKGKFDYMSPEQCLGKPLDRRSDVFAAGIVLYELSTGTRLFKRATLPATVRAITEEQPPVPMQLRPDYPPALWRVCSRALARDVDARYETAAALRKDLLAALRNIDADDDRAESVANVMHEVFDDRIAEKTEMLRRLRLGGSEIVVPNIETDSAIDIPIAIDAETRATRIERRTPRRIFVWIAAGGLAVGGAALAVALRHGAPSPSVTPPAAPSAAAVPPAPPPPAASTAPQPPASVTLHVESTPPGARVIVGGTDRGPTPLDLALQRSADALVLDVQKPGFVAEQQTVVPDGNQRISVVLGRKVKKAVSKPAHTAVAAPPAPTADFAKFN
jgi:serine/threonine protein kinase